MTPGQFDDQSQPNKGGMNKGQQNQGGSDRTNPYVPSGTTNKSGQPQSAGNRGNRPADDDFGDQGETPGQNRRESGQVNGSGSSGAASGNRGSSGGTTGSNR